MLLSQAALRVTCAMRKRGLQTCWARRAVWRFLRRRRHRRRRLRRRRRRLLHRHRCRLRARLRLRHRRRRRCVCQASGAATIVSASCVSPVATAIKLTLTVALLVLQVTLLKAQLQLNARFVQQAHTSLQRARAHVCCARRGSIGTPQCHRRQWKVTHALVAICLARARSNRKQDRGHALRSAPVHRVREKS